MLTMYLVPGTLQQEITTAAHDAIRDALLESASLADHYIKAEPSDLYPNPIANTRVDGVVGT